MTMTSSSTGSPPPPPDLELSNPRPGVAILRLNRPDRLNALTWDMIERLHVCLDEVGRDPDIRMLAITGNGRGFCSGLDMAAGDTFGQLDPVRAPYHRQERVAALAVALRNLPQPIVAAVNGPAAGGGFALALAADMRVCARSSSFHVGFIRIGLSAADVGVSFLLPRVVGSGVAAELMLTGRAVGAEEAGRIGLANKVVEDDQLMNATDSLIDEVIRNSPFGVQMTKQVLRRNLEAGSLESAIELENRTQILVSRSADSEEALAAFRDDRPPRFETAE